MTNWFQKTETEDNTDGMKLEIHEHQKNNIKT